MRPCWEPAPVAAIAHATRSATGDVAVATRLRGGSDGIRQPRTFVPIEELRRAAKGGADGDAAAGVTGSAGRTDPAPDRWSLWGDPDV